MKLLINARREGYAADQCKGTMTVGELIAFLSDFNENAPVFLQFDRGYTFGSIRETDFEEVSEENEEY